MIDSDLNRKGAGIPLPKAAERFDIKRHVHQQEPFVTSFKMFICVLAAGITLAASLLGGAYLLGGGAVPEFSRIAPDILKRSFEEARETISPNAEATSPKTLEEETKHFFSLYKDRWNEGAFPSGLASTNFRAFGPNGKELKDPFGFYDSSINLVAFRIPKITRLSDDKLQVDVEEQRARRTTMNKYYVTAERDPRPDPILEVEVARLQYEIERSTMGKDGSRWSLVSRRWVSVVGKSTIRQADDGESAGETGDFAEVTTEIEDRRLTREVLQSRYETMAARLSNWEFPVEDTFKSGYRLSLEKGTKQKTAAELQSRLYRMSAHLTSFKVTATLLSVGDTDDARATTEVKYRAEFMDREYPIRYVAIWRDRDTWATAQKTGSWYLLHTDRIYRSPLMEHYEELASKNLFHGE